MLTVQTRNRQKPLLCLTVLLIQHLRSSLCDKTGAKRKGQAVDPLEAFRAFVTKEEVAQPDHTPSEHASTLISSVLLFMMLKAKHRLMYLVG